MSCDRPSTGQGTAESPFVIQPGEPLQVDVLFERAPRDPIDLTDFTGTSQLRHSPYDGEVEPVATGTVEVLEDALGAAYRGIARVIFPPSVTEWPQIEPGVYVFDVRLDHDSDPVSRLMSDVYHVKVLASVSREAPA